jgi:predicted amidophosphoribosyltransferase
MESWTRPDAPPTPVPRMCPDCGEPLEDGQRVRCRACVAASEQACREITDRAILPSDIAARRNA